MLNAIKAMISSKSEFLEAADMLYEEGSGTNLDNTIVLGEETEEDITDEPIDEEGEPEAAENKEDKAGAEGEDIMDAPADNEGPAVNPDPAGTEPEGDDMMNQSIDEPVEQPMPLPGDDLPTPVGRQTGEPVDGIDDILNAEIDLRSNTMKDTLPIPPAGANDSVSGDMDDSFLNQRIDAGYGGDSVPTGESTYTEGITLDGGDEGSSDSSDTPADEPLVDDSGSSEEPESEDNTVTAAVKDKVDEVTSDDSTGSTNEDEKNKALSKLADVTKNLEDAKKAILKAI